jgi:hypothetical protein
MFSGLPGVCGPGLRLTMGGLAAPQIWLIRLSSAPAGRLGQIHGNIVQA